ncbi:MAG: site-2 protease family protein [candidate division NC10 bacterium]|nr:site-2 protease family protein [candidate division NC10 bacterium]
MWDLSSRLAELTIILPPILLALTIHECAHGLIADRLGDPTARLMGRLTLNPLPHLDPIGTLALIFFHFGWAKPVPVNASNFRNPLRDMMWVAVAGPGANLLLAAVSAFVLRLLVGMDLPIYFYKMLYWSVYINVILAIFNVVPIPPLDGSRVLVGLLPPKQALSYGRMEPYGFIILIVLIYTGIVGRVISPAIAAVTNLLLG